MNNRCCFAGHSDINFDKTKETVQEIAEKLIVEHDVSEFWVGAYGSFDSCCVAAITDLKKKHKKIKLTLIIPYLTKGKEEYYKKFDNILIANIPLSTPKKFYIIKSNEFMVDNSEFLICFVERTWGGAAKTYEYAKRKKRQIFNISK